MAVKLLTDQHLEFLSFTGGCAGSYELIHVKMSHCWKPHFVAHITFDELTTSPPNAVNLSLVSFIAAESTPRQASSISIVLKPCSNE